MTDRKTADDHFARIWAEYDQAMAERSAKWSRLMSGRDASGTHGIQMFSIRREQGRLAELAHAVRLLASEPDRAGPWQPGLVAVLMRGSPRRP